MYNGHGDVVKLTTDTGVVVKTYVYDAFGEEQDIIDSDTNHFRYCGEYYDKETKTLYLRARYYSSATGRFTQEDPIKDGANWYGYCANNPVNLIDPSGLRYVMKDLVDCGGSASDSSATITPDTPVDEKEMSATNKAKTVGIQLTKTENHLIALFNYIYNSIVSEGLDDYVKTGQGNTLRVSACRLGYTSVSFAGCEAIAMYDAMIALGDKQSFADILLYCEQHSYAMSLLGTDWEAIPEYFEKKGYDVKYGYNYKDYNNLLDNSQACICTFWTDDGVDAGIHTVYLFKQSDGQIVVYNRFSDISEEKPYESIEKFISGTGGIIQFIGIDVHHGGGGRHS